MYYILIKIKNNGINSLYKYYTETIEDIECIYSTSTLEEINKKIDKLHRIYNKDSVVVVKGMKINCVIDVIDEPVVIPTPDEKVGE